ncbi:MAG TPA: PEP/pyruvate-binding domain-containing protein, partial [Pyrinomonadaceae bacterium]
MPDSTKTVDTKAYVLDLSEVGSGDVAIVGGKSASLGELFRELTQQGVRAVDGFSTTSYAYEKLLEGGLRKELQKLLKGLDVNNLEELARVGSTARQMILDAPFPEDVETAIIDSYHRLGKRIGKRNFEVAVRSSATAEDLPDASFAGQQDTILNVKGEPAIIAACHECYASLWTDRAISYRTAKKFDHFDVALSIAIQPMVRSDIACSGVMFTLDTESGFRDVVVINGAWGLGEAVVQ